MITFELIFNGGSARIEAPSQMFAAQKAQKYMKDHDINIAQLCLQDMKGELVAVSRFVFPQLRKGIAR